MIMVQTRLVISDNSGGLIAQCIKILGHSNRKVARVGDVIVVSIKEVPTSAETASSSSGGSGSKKSDKGMSTKNKAKSPKGGFSGVRKGEVHKALVIRTKVNSCLNPHGLQGMTFEDNAVIILNNKQEPLGTRIFGPVNSFELRRRPIAGSLKILALAQLSL
jgi:large subunit ribosomal protein L14